jgi:ethanolamine utilization protein EutA (predicted chaperonin)
MKIIYLFLTLFMLLGSCQEAGAFGEKTDIYVIKWLGITKNTADNAPNVAATKNGTSTGTADQAIVLIGTHTTSISCSTITADVVNASTDIDIDVIASQDGTYYDTGNSYVDDFFLDLGDNEQDTMALTPGPLYIKLRLDNAHADNTAGCNCRVTVRWN